MTGSLRKRANASVQSSHALAIGLVAALGIGSSLAYADEATPGHRAIDLSGSPTMAVTAAAPLVGGTGRGETSLQPVAKIIDHATTLRPTSIGDSRMSLQPVASHVVSAGLGSAGPGTTSLGAMSLQPVAAIVNHAATLRPGDKRTALQPVAARSGAMGLQTAAVIGNTPSASHPAETLHQARTSLQPVARITSAEGLRPESAALAAGTTSLRPVAALLNGRTSLQPTAAVVNAPNPMKRSAAIGKVSLSHPASAMARALSTHATIHWAKRHWHGAKSSASGTY